MEPYYQDESVVIYFADCREVLPLLADKSVDHVITDPPYEAEAHTKGRRILNPRTKAIREAPLSFAEMTPDLRRASSAEFARLSRRWSLVFCQVEAAMLWRADLEAGGARYVRTMVWVKPNGQPQLTGDRPGMGYESIVAAHSQQATRWNGGGRLGWFICPVDANFSRAPRLHETQKPIKLIREIVALFTDPDDLILDSFMGSGTTLHAAKELGRRAIGVDNVERNCEIAAERLMRIKAGYVAARSKEQATLPLTA